MDLRQLTPDIAVCGQIQPEDLAAIAKAGFRVLIDNRPDAEVGDAEDSAAMRDAAELAGLEFHYQPFVPGTITSDMVVAFAEATHGRGPVFAYCRSGNRSSILWALSQAGRRPTAEIVETVAKAGYDISQFAPMIDALSTRG